MRVFLKKHCVMRLRLYWKHESFVPKNVVFYGPGINYAKFKKCQVSQISHNFDSFVLRTSVPSEMSILSEHIIYNIQTFISKYEPFSKSML